MLDFALVRYRGLVQAGERRGRRTRRPGRHDRHRGRVDHGDAGSTLTLLVAGAVGSDGST